GLQCLRQPDEGAYDWLTRSRGLVVDQAAELVTVEVGQFDGTCGFPSLFWPVEQDSGKAIISGQRPARRGHGFDPPGKQGRLVAEIRRFTARPEALAFLFLEAQV